MDWVEGFILTGGASSRMGTDKSRLVLNGLTFAERIAQVMSSVTRSVKVVGPDAHDIGLESRTDVFKQWGALGGLHAALSACTAEWCVVVACDLPFVTADLFKRLASFVPGFEAVVPVQPDGFLQPLCAFYRIDPCLGRSEELIKAGQRRPVSLLESVNARTVEFAELCDLDGANRFFDNINTPEDYLRATKGGFPQ
jgi:molybdopterin-guanine dinucleotide biosynthesis protein A